MGGKWSLSFLHYCTLWTRASRVQSQILGLREDWLCIYFRKHLKTKEIEYSATLFFEMETARVHYSKDARWWVLHQAFSCNLIIEQGR